MAGRLRGWLALSGPDRARVLMMMIALPTVAAALRLFGYVRIRRWLERRSAAGQTRTATAAEVERAIELARLAALAGRRGPIAANCLPQSLLVYWLLRRRSLAPELKIGVRKQDVALDAHAWVELQGQSLDPVQATFQPFPSH